MALFLGDWMPGLTISLFFIFNFFCVYASLLTTGSGLNYFLFNFKGDLLVILVKATGLGIMHLGLI